MSSTFYLDNSLSFQPSQAVPGPACRLQGPFVQMLDKSEGKGNILCKIKKGKEPPQVLQGWWGAEGAAVALLCGADNCMVPSVWGCCQALCHLFNWSDLATADTQKSGATSTKQQANLACLTTANVYTHQWWLSRHGDLGPAPCAELTSSPYGAGWSEPRCGRWWWGW